MKLPHRKKTARQSIKEAMDNLPAGICFFDRSGLLVLCNLQMQRLSHAIAGRDLQLQSEIESWQHSLPENSPARKDGEIFVLRDGTAWQLERRETAVEERKYTEFIASDVTELYRRKRQLEEGVREQRRALRSMENISHNLAAITRGEEALRLKMKIHNDLGAALNLARQYLSDGCPAEGKADFIARQRDMSQILLDESHNREDDDPLKDLHQVAEGLGMKIELEGGEALTPGLRRVLSYAIRECLTNTVRHAGGDTVYVDLRAEGERLCCTLTNNGKPPEKEIAEGGGLSSLREKMRRCGGTMEIESLPRFVMKITLPQDARDD